MEQESRKKWCNFPKCYPHGGTYHIPYVTHVVAEVRQNFKPSSLEDFCLQRHLSAITVEVGLGGSKQNNVNKSRYYWLAVQKKNDGRHLNKEDRRGDGGLLHRHT